MKTQLLATLALLPCLLPAACDDPTADERTAEMIEICEELDGDCDEAIEDYLAEVEGVDAADEQSDAVGPSDGPGSLWEPPACTHCNDGPRDRFETPTTPDAPVGPIDPIDSFDPNGTSSANVAHPIDALDAGPRPTHDDAGHLAWDDVTPDPYPTPNPATEPLAE